MRSIRGFKPSSGTPGRVNRVAFPRSALCVALRGLCARISSLTWSLLARGRRNPLLRLGECGRTARLCAGSRARWGLLMLISSLGLLEAESGRTLFGGFKSL